MTTPERSVEEIAEEHAYAPTQFNTQKVVAVSRVKELLQAERQKRDEMVEAERERIKLDIEKHMSLDGVSLINGADVAVPWQADEYQCAMRNALRLITQPNNVK